MLEPGQSGNPAGRTPGTGKVNQYQKLLESRLPELVDVLVTQALAGEPTALRMCFERLIPAYRSKTMPINLDIPDRVNLTNIGNSIIQSITQGRISVEAGAQLMSALTGQAKLIEITDLKKRIELLKNVSNETEN